jgi:hypothetical protein
MTAQQHSDRDGGDERARAEAGERRDSEIAAKSYRYLRLAMVGLLLCLAAAVGYQSVRQGWPPLGSVSAYYYTPAQAFFVAGLIGLGACMIALKGTTPVEDIFLNLGGVFAVIVALVPTGRNADYEAARRACEEAGTPLLTEKASTGSWTAPRSKHWRPPPKRTWTTIWPPSSSWAPSFSSPPSSLRGKPGPCTLRPRGMR